jgi:hypothetical protein
MSFAHVVSKPVGPTSTHTPASEGAPPSMPGAASWSTQVAVLTALAQTPWVQATAAHALSHGLHPPIGQ